MQLSLDVALSSDVDVPIGHSEHLMEPTLSLYVPLGQSKQSPVCPSTGVNLPAGQEEHGSAPLYELVPALHALDASTNLYPKLKPLCPGVTLADTRTPIVSGDTALEALITFSPSCR